MPVLRSLGLSLVGVGLSLACMGLSRCQAETLNSVHLSTSITVDGRFDEWLNLPGQFYTNPRVALSVANDSARLYVHLRTSDDQVAQLIRRTGITLYLDKSGGKGKDFFVRFRGGPSRRDMKTGRERGEEGENRPEGRLETTGFDRPGGDDSLRRGPEFTCYQKDRIIEKPIPTDGSAGPAAAYAFQEGFHSFEFSVPLEQSRVRYYGLGAGVQGKVGIGLVWGEMNKEQMPQRRPEIDFTGGPDGPEGPMGGSPGGMGGGGGPGGPPSGNRPSMPEKQELWLKVQLASGPAAESAKPSDK